ncbi:cytochrome c [uncultured Sulfitobacter sp.]|uniref:c-type cytochrome n=1 Tax=uncultured Sulfitobacter sp. TaxID=191468 RepID=UPI00341886B9
MNLGTFSALGLGMTILSACTQVPFGTTSAVARGQTIYAKECSQCHGTRGDGVGATEQSLGIAPPNITELAQRNDGVFPREFVRRFVLGQLEKNDPNAAMPEFSTVGLGHVYPDGGVGAEVLEADFEDLLDYLETIQR